MPLLPRPIGETLLSCLLDNALHYADAGEAVSMSIGDEGMSLSAGEGKAFRLTAQWCRATEDGGEWADLGHVEDDDPRALMQRAREQLIAPGVYDDGAEECEDA